MCVCVFFLNAFLCVFEAFNLFVVLGVFDVFFLLLVIFRVFDFFGVWVFLGFTWGAPHIRNPYGRPHMRNTSWGAPT